MGGKGAGCKSPGKQHDEQLHLLLLWKLLVRLSLLWKPVLLSLQLIAAVTAVDCCCQLCCLLLLPLPLLLLCSAGVCNQKEFLRHDSQDFFPDELF